MSMSVVVQQPCQLDYQMRYHREKNYCTLVICHTRESGYPENDCYNLMLFNELLVLFMVWIPPRLSRGWE